MNRRGFLSGMLALGAAAAIVRADSLMRVVPIETSVLAGLQGLQLVSAPTLAEIISATLRSRQAQLADNIERNNRILKSMRGRGLVVDSIDYKSHADLLLQSRAR